MLHISHLGGRRRGGGLIGNGGGLFHRGDDPQQQANLRVVAPPLPCSSSPICLPPPDREKVDVAVVSGLSGGHNVLEVVLVDGQLFERVLLELPREEGNVERVSSVEPE